MKPSIIDTISSEDAAAMIRCLIFIGRVTAREAEGATLDELISSGRTSAEEVDNLRRVRSFAPICSVVLPIDLSNDPDTSAAENFHQLLERLKKMGFQRDPFGSSVTLCVTRILGEGQQLWDIRTARRGNWRSIERALVELGWFDETGCEPLTHARFFQDGSRQKEGPAIEIEVFR